MELHAMPRPLHRYGGPFSMGPNMKRMKRMKLQRAFSRSKPAPAASKGWCPVKVQRLSTPVDPRCASPCAFESEIRQRETERKPGVKLWGLPSIGHTQLSGPGQQTWYQRSLAQPPAHAVMCDMAGILLPTLSQIRAYVLQFRPGSLFRICYIQTHQGSYMWSSQWDKA